MNQTVSGMFDNNCGVDWFCLFEAISVFLTYKEMIQSFTMRERYILIYIDRR
jgi:hypothetical protein